MKFPLSGICLALCLAFPAALTLAEPAKSESAAIPWIEWDRTTDHVISEADDKEAGYPRAKQLSNGEILLAYHHGDGFGAYGAWIKLRKSHDGGKTWSQSRDVDGPTSEFWGFSNPDFIELGGERMLLVSAARGKAQPGRDEFLSECERSGLRLRFSNDFGNTWSKPRMVAAGRGRVWEPSIVRLPNGELQIFYANEAPELNWNQRIESIRSYDDGQTWSAPMTVSQDPGCRNGMPSALALGDGHVACAQEVVGKTTSPWITDTLGGRPLDSRLAQKQYGVGSAPFLALAPDGGTLLTFHSQQGKPPPPDYAPFQWMYQHIYVQHGDAQAKHFGPASCPWPWVSARTGVFFPSLMIEKDGTVVALASFVTVMPDNSSRTVVRWIKGRLKGAAMNPRDSTAAD